VIGRSRVSAQRFYSVSVSPSDSSLWASVSVSSDGSGAVRASSSVSVFASPLPTTSASQNLRLILVMRTLTLSPGFVFGTKTTSPLIRAMPSPLRLVSWISTSYSLPISTGFGGNLGP